MREQRYTFTLILYFVLENSHEHPQAIEAWKQTQTWNGSMRFKGRWQGTESHLKNSEIASSSCRCTTTSIGRKMETYRCVSRILEKLRLMHKRFPQGHWSFPRRGTEEKWYGTHTYKPASLWNRSAVMIMFHLRESGDPIFQATSASDRGALKKQGGKLSIHHGDFVDSRAVVSHNHFRQRTRCSRCDIGLARRTGSAGLRSFFFQHGQTRGDYV